MLMSEMEMNSKDSSSRDRLREAGWESTLDPSFEEMLVVLRANRLRDGKASRRYSRSMRKSKVEYKMDRLCTDPGGVHLGRDSQFQSECASSRLVSAGVALVICSALERSPTGEIMVNERMERPASGISINDSVSESKLWCLVVTSVKR